MGIKKWWFGGEKPESSRNINPIKNLGNPNVDKNTTINEFDTSNDHVNAHKKTSQ